MVELVTSHEAARRPGRFRIAAGAVVLVLLAMAALSAWRLRSVAGIPDVGDPFDVVAARRPIDLPDAENAYTFYERAHAALVRRPKELHLLDFGALEWSKAGPAVRDYLEKNRPALELFRTGCERPDAIYHQPGELRIDTVLPVVQELRTMTELAGLEGTRLESLGDQEGAWGWYRAMLRCSRLIGRHGVIIERGVGNALHRKAALRIDRWASDPKVDAPLLRRALAETIADDAMTPPLSEALKLEYLIYLRDLTDLRLLPAEIPMPGGKDGVLNRVATSVGVKDAAERLWLRASNDDERSRRAARMLFANWLAQVDRPPAARAPVAVRLPTAVYAPDPTAPPAARAIAPEELARIVDRNVLSAHIFRAGQFPFSSSPRGDGGLAWDEGGPFAIERRRRSALIVRMAAELFRRETGHPPKSVGELVGPCLEELPDGVAASDPIPKSID